MLKEKSFYKYLYIISDFIGLAQVLRKQFRKIFTDCCSCKSKSNHKSFVSLFFSLFFVFFTFMLFFVANETVLFFINLTFLVFMFGHDKLIISFKFQERTFLSPNYSSLTFLTLFKVIFSTSYFSSSSQSQGRPFKRSNSICIKF